MAERRVADERLLVPVRSDVSKPVEILALNETGGVIWDALAQPRDLDELAAALASEFEVTADAARADAEAFVHELRRLDLITEAAA